MLSSLDIALILTEALFGIIFHLLEASYLVLHWSWCHLMPSDCLWSFSTPAVPGTTLRPLSQYVPRQCMTINFTDWLSECVPIIQPHLHPFIWMLIFPRVLYFEWCLASRCPWWATSNWWQRSVACWRVLLLISMFQSHKQGQTSRWYWLVWSFWISLLMSLQVLG